MHWYSPERIKGIHQRWVLALLSNTFSFLILLGLNSCSPADEQGVPTHESVNTYFDIAGYFTEEARKLQQAAPQILKTVAKNDEEEEQQLQIKNWNNELELFISSDINRPAWTSSYLTDSNDMEIRYTAMDSDLRTKIIHIKKHVDNSISEILIVNETENMLYSTKETLHYFPDSAYSIRKEQQVKIVGRDDYQISGKIIRP